MKKWMMAALFCALLIVLSGCTAVDEALAQLPAKYRTAIHLHYYEGYTTDEIARITHQRPSAVRTQLTRARRMLGELLKGDE